MKLYTVVLRPAHAAGPLPFLIIRTPYGADRGAKGLSENKNLPDDQYLFVYQDLRGRYQSEGTFVMMRPVRDRRDPKAIDESTDAYDTVAWLLGNVAGNNGRAGMYGVSYPGWTTVMAMIDPHPALKAVSEQASPADMYLTDDFHHNGAFRLSYGFEYAAQMETGKENYQFPFDRADTFEWYLNLGPLSRVNSTSAPSVQRGTITSPTPITMPSGSGRPWPRGWASRRCPTSTWPAGGTRKITPGP